MSAIKLEKEITISECLGILRGKKHIFIAMFAVSVILSTVYILRTPYKYEATALIRIGTYPRYAKDEIIDMIKSKNTLGNISSLLHLNDTYAQLKDKIRIEETSGEHFINLVVVYQKPGLALTICELAANSFVDDSNETYDASIASNKEAFERLNKKFGMLNKTHSADTAATYQFVHDYLKRKIYLLKVKISESQRFAILKTGTPVKYPDNPQILKKFVIAVLIGIILGIFLVFAKQTFKAIF
jgi:capsular polysaccharide biosynthesis protein